jgi:tetratricopeptide (TPR) repeat protein/TolB-like protein
MAEVHPTTSKSEELPQPLSGTVVGRFIIRERLGRGGMGEVYRAEDMRLKRDVALKRLAPSLRADPIYRLRFQQESERVSRFSDPHIAAIYDVVEEQSELFLVMEYIEGENLRQRLRRPMTLDQFFDIATQCAEALIAAHERGVVHCDIKPENVMLTTTGQVKILDFGVAKHLPRSDQSSTVDRAGTTGGTPAYMSPEVLLENIPDARADIFSLGIVFYEMLTGNHPFLAASFVATTDRIRYETPTPIRIFNPAVPEFLEAVVLKAMAKQAAQRYASGAELLQDLQTVRMEVTPSKLHGMLARPHRARTWKKAWIAGPVLIVVVLLGFGVYRAVFKNWPRWGQSSAPVALAVLPFSLAGNDMNAKAFGDGLTETLTAKLTQLTGSHPLEVVPASEIRAEGVGSVEQARRDFGVGLVLSGSLHQSGNQVRVTYSLVDAKTRRQVDAGTLDANLSDPFAVEDQVVSGALAMLGLEIKGSERVVLAAHGTHDPSAYDQYLRGRGYLLEYHKPENIDSAIASFNRALSLDPNYPQAYAALGEAYWQGYQEGQRGKDWIEKASSACEHAVSAAPQLADGHACLGRVYSGTGEYEKAASEFQKATAFDPTSDDAYRGLAHAYQKLNRPAEAETTYRQAIRLRPQYWAGYSWLGFFYFQQGKYDQAAKMFMEVISLAPDNFRGYSNLGAMYFLEGRYQEAISVLEKSVSIRPTTPAYNNLGNAYFCKRQFEAAAHSFEEGLKLDSTSWLSWGNLADAYYWVPGKQQEALHSYREAIRLAEEKLRLNPRDGDTLAYRATYLAMTGQKDEALASLQKAVSLSPKGPDVRFRGALVYNHLGDTDQTLAWLQQALSLGLSAATVRNTPDFDRLRGDVRMQRLLGGNQIAPR